ncbi:immunoglobulin gamma-1 heavy chain-like [Astyanax mexicanus]|nr:immunoglobulin gamma-1 heavy chain-like [Astyanax mexicanus]
MFGLIVDDRIKNRHSHSAVSGWLIKVFGEGTRLFVTESGKSAVKPKLSAYPISRPSNGRSVLLCQARDMYPDLVRFIWKDQAGKEVTVSDTVELLEQRDEEEVRVTSMLIIDQQKAQSNTFTCSVQHDSSIDTTNNELKVTIPKGNICLCVLGIKSVVFGTTGNGIVM